MTEAAQARVAMNDLYLLSNDNVPENRKEGKDCWHSGFSVDDQKGDMVDLESIGQVVDSSSTVVGMSYDHDFVPPIYQLGR
jgi:hypothetical protein